MTAKPDVPTLADLDEHGSIDELEATFPTITDLETAPPRRWQDQAGTWNETDGTWDTLDAGERA